jgi:N-acyl-D-amino-acid deacylase
LLDLLIKNGRVISGTGNPWFKADVAVQNGKIVRIGLIGEVEVKRTIDAKGLVVSPGFVDIHNHSDFNIMINPQAESMIRQGVTMLVFPNCGSGGAPLNDEMKEELRTENPDFLSAGLDFDWSTFDEYLRKIERIGTSVNVAPLIGFGTIRQYVMGYEMRAPTKGELGEMKSEVEKAMKTGAFGFTTGLRYVPQSFAETDEVIELSKVAAKHGGFYTSHLRDEGDRGDPIGSVKEIIKISQEAKLPVNISHFKILSKTHWKDCAEILRLIDEARTGGVDITADQYPYSASGSGPGAWIPRWAHEGGTGSILKRMRDLETGSKIKDDMAHVMDVRGGPESALISYYPPNMTYVGKTIADVAKILKKHPNDTLFDLYKEYLEQLVTGKVKGRFSFNSFNMSEENVDAMMKKPWVMASTDGRISAPYGILGKVPHNHPRYYGTYPRILGKYVREKKVLSLEEAIKKMTSLETQRLGIFDRGLVAEGMWADLTIFDSEKVIDRAQYTPPEESKRYPEGIDYVIVNGTITIDKGEHTGSLAGKVLRKKR